MEELIECGMLEIKQLPKIGENIYLYKITFKVNGDSTDFYQISNAPEQAYYALTGSLLKFIKGGSEEIG